MAGAAKKRQARERRENMNEAPSRGQEAADPSDRSASSGSPPPNLDGNRDPVLQERAGNQPPGQAVAAVNRNIDIGARGASIMRGAGDITELPLRPAQLNRAGRDVTVRLNTYHVVDYPSKPVYQWDVLIGNGDEKRGLIRRVWESKKVLKELGQGWIFDGNKLAWSTTKPMGKVTFEVDLDQEKGKPALAGKRADVHRVVVKLTKQLDFTSLRAYLNRSLLTINESVLEAINFLDHLMRETPSQKFVAIKRNFFARGQQRVSLGGGIEAFKGVYASIRMVNLGPGVPASLSVNVDVANTTFWTASKLHIAAAAFLGKNLDSLANELGAGNNQNRNTALVSLRKLRKLQVYTTHREPAEVAMKDPWTIGDIMNQNARTHKFKKTDATGKEREISIEQYFKEECKITLQYPTLPVVQMTKAKVILPMELCNIKENQRYSAKLSGTQTTKMINFAVTLPGQRWESISNGVKMLDWGNDRYLANYGLKIADAPTAVKARLLPNPKVGFTNKQEDPRTSGRWDLRGKVFASPHPVPLKAWGVSIAPGRSGSKEQAQAFLTTFMNIFTGHGGRITNKAPIILQGSDNVGKDVEELWQAVGRTNKQNPQLLVFIVSSEDSQRYQRIKRSCDCRYGVVSQVLQAKHVEKNQAQYCSNVSMKVNAKLGGMTSKAIGATKPFTKPTMVIGADVSHGAPGSQAASVMSVTISWDREAIRYAAAVQTNGLREEMITPDNFEKMVKPLVARWISTIGNGQPPAHVLYFRDGVSEGQYTQVLNKEVKELQKVFPAIPQMTVIVASKRHHIRFFPDQASGDKNGNPQPGTLVETGVTHPFEYDFYLNAHSAIKGTARPMHYHVLRDDAKMGVEQLQSMIYEHSYQYVRSTTPVSMFPAVYYAHLAAARAVAHINQPVGAPSETTGASPKDDAAVGPLTEMNNQNGIKGAMWYI